MNLVSLKTFVDLSKTKSFRAAAHLNFVTQSAVSQQVNALERKLKCRLVERNQKTVHLTHAGEVFLKYAEKIIEQYENAVEDIAHKKDSYQGNIKIATIYSIGLYNLQPFIRSFLRKYPEINIFLEYYHNDLIYEKVLNQTIDFGFVAFPRKNERLSPQVISEQEMVLIQCPQRPSFKMREITARDLNNCRCVALSQRTPTGKEILNYFKKMSVKMNVIHEFENVETLKSAAIIGMGCAFVPRNSIQQELKNKSLEIVHVKDVHFKRPIAILHSKSKEFSRAKKKFFELMVDWNV